MLRCKYEQMTTLQKICSKCKSNSTTGDVFFYLGEEPTGPKLVLLGTLALMHDNIPEFIAVSKDPKRRLSIFTMAGSYLSHVEVVLKNKKDDDGLCITYKKEDDSFDVFYESEKAKRGAFIQYKRNIWATFQRHFAGTRDEMPDVIRAYGKELEELPFLYMDNMDVKKTTNELYRWITMRVGNYYDNRDDGVYDEESMEHQNEFYDNDYHQFNNDICTTLCLHHDNH